MNGHRHHHLAPRGGYDGGWDNATATSERFNSGSSCVNDMPPGGVRRDRENGIPRHVSMRDGSDRDYGKYNGRSSRDMMRDRDPYHYGDRYRRRSSQEESIRTPETASMTNSRSSGSIRRSESGASSYFTDPTNFERGPSLDMSSSRLSDSRGRGTYDDPYDRYPHPDDSRRRDRDYPPTRDYHPHPEDRRPPPLSSPRTYHEDRHRPPPHHHGPPFSSSRRGPPPPPPRDYDPYPPDDLPYYPEPSRRSGYDDRRGPPPPPVRMMDDRSYVSAMDERDYGMRRDRRPYPIMERGGYDPRYPEDDYDRRPPSFDDRTYHSHQPERSYRPHRPTRRPSFDRHAREYHPHPHHRHPDEADDCASVKSKQPPRLPPRRATRDRNNPMMMMMPSRMPPRNTSRSSTTSGNNNEPHYHFAGPPRSSSQSSSHGSSSSNGGGVVMVDISPGVKARLRRTQETREAVANDFYTAVGCLACHRELFCIADVSWFLCPDCKVISPLEEQQQQLLPDHHGLGMGFTAETLMAMQSEVFAKKHGY